MAALYPPSHDLDHLTAKNLLQGDLRLQRSCLLLRLMLLAVRCCWGLSFL